jgi:hypothetical protein
MAKKGPDTAVKVVPQPTLKQLFAASDSLQVVERILDETILDKAAEVIYLKYLVPKVKPYTALHALESVNKSLQVGQL